MSDKPKSPPIDQNPSQPDATITELIERSFVIPSTMLDLEELTQALTKEITLSIPEHDPLLVMLLGGVGSGKTTLSRSLKNALVSSGVPAAVIATDDYLIEDRAYRRKHFTGQDSRTKYDFKFLNQKVREIMKNPGNGETIGVPTYNPDTGIAIAEGEKNYSHQVGRVDVLIVEGDFLEVVRPDLTIYLHVAEDQRLINELGREQSSTATREDREIVERFNQRQLTQHIPFTAPAAAHADLIIRLRETEPIWQYEILRPSGPRIVDEA